MLPRAFSPLVLLLMFAVAPSAAAGPVVRSAAGANAAAIQAAVDQFRTDLGTLNPNQAGSFGSGRREINWDGVSDALSSPNNLPADFFNTTSPRGVVFATLGSAFQVSARAASGTTPRFGNILAQYATIFQAFSQERLFAAIGHHVMDVRFFVPGSNTRAAVSGFGAVFTDVDSATATTIEYFDPFGRSLGRFTVPAHNEGLSFLGVSFDAGERVGRVVITSGNRALGTTDAGAAADVVVMDDFIYGEPVAEPGLHPGELDLTFDGDGMRKVNLPDSNIDHFTAVAVQPDGKIVAAGFNDGGLPDFAVARLNPDGSLDTSFGGQGINNPPGIRTFTFGAGAFGGHEKAADVALQPDGKIVLVGFTDAGTGVTNGTLTRAAIARLNSDGSLDTTFGVTGLVTVDLPDSNRDEFTAVALQPDGKIVAAGFNDGGLPDFAVARFNPDGSLDTSFGGQGVNNFPGIRTFTFGAPPWGGHEKAGDVLLQPDGKIVLVGFTDAGTGVTNGTQTRAAIARLNSDGSLDTSFGVTGLVTVNLPDSNRDEFTAVDIQPDGRIVAAGFNDGGLPDFAVARFNADGSLDTSFGGQGVNNFPGIRTFTFGNPPFGGHEKAEDVAILRDGRILVVGFTDAGTGVTNGSRFLTALALLNPDGSLDTGFGIDGRLTTDFGSDGKALGVALQPDGQVIVSGFSFEGAAQLATVARYRIPYAPVVTITSPTTSPTFTATTPFITLMGTATDETGISSVEWSNSLGGSGLAEGTTSWIAANIPLKKGVNVITITATDFDGLATAAVLGGELNGSTRTSQDIGSTGTSVLTVTVDEFKYYLAEGATGAFFDLDVLLANPNGTPAPVTLSFLKDDGTTVSLAQTLAPHSRTTIRVDSIPGLEATAVSTVVSSTDAVPIVVERTMFWDATYYGSHTGEAVEGASTRWLFAEGSQGFFDTYVLLANDHPTLTANVTVTFLTEFDGPVVRQFAVPRTTRLNVFTGLIPELIGKSFSIVVDSDIPIFAERAMYFGTPLFNGGHASPGVTAPATSWFLAEGATGAFFDTFILVGNANPSPATVTFRFLTAAGLTVERVKVIPANSRLTVYVEGEDPALADVAVSTTVTSDLPVIAERAMYWAGPFTSWYEAHNSFGVTSTAIKWGLAEGRVGTDRQFETYILLANPTNLAATVRITYLRSGGLPAVVKTYIVQPTSRFNVYVNGDVPELVNENFGALIEVLNDVPIAVERALYNDSGGVFWAAGTNATATRLP